MEKQSGRPEQEMRVAENEVNLLDMLAALARNKNMILGVTFGAAVLSAGLTLLMSNIYTASTKILPPQQSQSSASAVLSQLGGLAGMGGAMLGLKNQNDLYVTMLRSWNLNERIAKRFDIVKEYELSNMGDAIEILVGKVRVDIGKDGVIVVEVDDKNPKLAADMANAYAEELDKLMTSFALTGASQKRVFFEQQMKQAKDKLTDAERVLDRTPQTSLQYLDAVRNLKYQEAVWEILAKQFELAKLDEAKDFPLLQVLDKAVPPERKSKPKRSIIVIKVLFAAFVLSCLWVLYREMGHRIAGGMGLRGARRGVPE